MPKLKQKAQSEFAVEELKNRLARALADYDNLVKRQAREREDVFLRSIASFVSDLLPVADDIVRAQEHLQDDGLKMGLDHFYRVLDAHGVIEISAKIGDQFDSLIHEAVDSIEGGVKNTLAQVLTKGYKWKDGKIIRPAKVAVYKEKGETLSTNI